MTLKFIRVLEAVEIRLRAKFQAKCSGSYQHCTRFRTTLLRSYGSWNGSSSRQAGNLDRWRWSSV